MLFLILAGSNPAASRVEVAKLFPFIPLRKFYPQLSTCPA
jgi:hypothetical protein